MREILLLRNKFEDYIIEEMSHKITYLIPGSKLDEIGNWYGTNRSEAFRKISKFIISKNDLEERDRYYNHMLIINKKEQDIIGGQRFRFNYEIEDNIYKKSYLETSHPGIHKKILSTNKAFVEVGRTFVMPKYQKQSSLKELIRGFIKIPEALNIELALGMISFNHNDLKKESIYTFLNYLENCNFKGNLNIDTPNSVRHLLYKKKEISTANINLKELQEKINLTDQNFKMPDVLRPYRIYCNIKYENFSYAEDYNKILQLLFSGRVKDLNTKTCHKLEKYNKKIERKKLYI